MGLGNVLTQQQIQDYFVMHYILCLVSILFPHYDLNAHENPRAGRTTSQLWKLDHPGHE